MHVSGKFSKKIQQNILSASSMVMVRFGDVSWTFEGPLRTRVTVS